MGERAIELELEASQAVAANDDLFESAVRSAPQRPRLSEILYGIRWEEHLPLTLEDSGVTVSVATWQEAAPFVEENYAAVFGDQSQFFQSSNSAARARYLEHAADIFMFRHEGRTVGSYIGNPTDWSTYYLRHSLLLPDYQGRKVVPQFVSWMLSVLRDAGVERVETDTAPSNMQMMAAMANVGFVSAGTLLSERWGAQCRFVLHLRDDAEVIYLRQFCSSGERHVATRRKIG